MAPVLLAMTQLSGTGTASCGTTWSSITATDSTGASHPFPGTYTSGSPTGCSAQYSQVASDGTGFTLVIPTSTTNYSQLNQYPYMLYDQSGNLVQQSVNGSTTTTTVTDPDSVTAKVTNASGTSTYTDTLATTVITAAPIYGGPDVYSYMDGSGTTQQFKVIYTQYNLQTSFQCNNGIGELSGTFYMPTSITTPAGNYSITYEQTPGYGTSYKTGRVAKITLPTGGYVSFGYTGGNSGFDCNSHVVPTLTRTVNDNNGNTGTWTYVNSNTSIAPGNFMVIETDPGNNQTVHYFSGDFQTQTWRYQGGCPTSTSSSCTGGGALLTTVTTCYNGNLTGCGAPSSPPDSSNYGD